MRILLTLAVVATLAGCINAPAPAAPVPSVPGIHFVGSPGTELEFAL